ncbi:MAG: SWIM zinc finger family protein [Thermoguttaceae bacterium]|nr:SWIM zinc finger family protein [Thermoguttaceae bacterium]
MEQFTNITEQAIRDRVGAAALAEGYQYMYTGALTGLELNGSILKASCKGRANKIYRVQAQLGDGEIVEAGCTCPDGLNGRCRHVAALVLTWLNRGENFQRGQSVKEIIETLSRAELEEILLQIVQRRPDAKTFVERSAPQTVDKRETLKDKDYRTIVEAALVSEASNNSLWEIIDSLKLLGEDMLRQREWKTAVDIFVNIYQVIRARHAKNESSAADEICRDCVEDLMRLAVGTLEEQQVKHVGDVLFQELADAIEFDGTLDKEVIRWMSEMPEAHINRWAAMAWDALHHCQSKPARRLWGMVCLVFYGSRLEDETRLKLYKEIGWFGEIAQQFALEHKFDQIAVFLDSADDYEALIAVERLMKMGFPKQAFALVEKRLETKPSDVLKEWLNGHQVQIKADQEAIELAERMFALRPDIESYHRLRSESMRAGIWEETQDQCLLKLKESQQYELLMDIFLEDWDLERAVFLWQEDPTKISRQQSIQLAQLAEGSQPITAIKIYQELLETQLQSLVEAKISSASAAGEAIQKEIEMLVSRLKTLITRVYGAEAWTEYLASLRNRDLRI